MQGELRLRHNAPAKETSIKAEQKCVSTLARLPCTLRSGGLVCHSGEHPRCPEATLCHGKQLLHRGHSARPWGRHGAPRSASPGLRVERLRRWDRCVLVSESFEDSG